MRTARQKREKTEIQERNEKIPKSRAVSRSSSVLALSTMVDSSWSRAYV